MRFTTVELLLNDSRKSFYNKAVIRKYANGTQVLYSYDTPIISISENGVKKALWHGWSATTGRHIRAFCGLNKSEYQALCQQ